MSTLTIVVRNEMSTFSIVFMSVVGIALLWVRYSYVADYDHILFGTQTSGNGESLTQSMLHENIFLLRFDFFSNLVPLFSKGL